MAVLMSVRTRLSNWLLVTQMRIDTYGPQLNKQFTKETVCSNPRFCCTSRFHSKLPAATAERADMWRHRQCLLCQKRHLGNAMTRVPQLDLQTDVEESGEPHPESTVDATEVLKNLSPEDARKLKIIKLEFDVVEQMYGMVPEKMSDDHWLIALQMDSKSKRQRYYVFLRKNEMKGKAKQRKQELKQQAQRLEEKPEKTELPPKNSIFMMVYDSTIKKAGNHRLANAMQYGQPLVFDLDYEQHMRHQDCQNLVDQLLLTYGKNRDAADPFNFIFSSLNPNGKILRMLHKGKLTGQHFLGTMTDKSYLDMFPRERLVYLSPHANRQMEEVNSDDIYIIGGFIDKSSQKPVSLARAKEQGIRTVKFPLDKHLLWGCGSKSLTLDQVMTILLEQRRTKDWEQALKVIPRRKLYRDNY